MSVISKNISLRRFFLTFACLLTLHSLQGQVPVFSRQDSLRGTIYPERAWWDLTYYHLNIEVNPDEKTIQGVNTIQYKVLEPAQRMQIDLQPPMEVEKVLQDGQELKTEREGNVYYISLKEPQKPGAVNAVEVYFGGKPPESKRPPWSGGITWTKDARGNHWIANSNQGEGASMWWPNKDHMYDEVDSMLISVNVPKNLTDVSNGRLRGIDELKNGTRTFHWFVSNPINNYGVNISIGDYAHFSEKYKGEKGVLDCDYYVLKYNLAKAKKQFQQVPMMLEAFEYWFGPYPFYEDGYKLVEVPYLGMEHQSAVTYGNEYKNGYKGKDLSRTGHGFKFDFIIIHESGHEWFANNITNKDIADMWIHESFTSYSESLYLEYHFGKEAAAEYVQGTRYNIKNDRPAIGFYGVNHEGSSDMYFKGANMLHTLRQLIGDDEKWRSILRGINSEFYHQTVTSTQIEHFLSRNAGMDLEPVFDQYLRTAAVPVLEYRFLENNLHYRWSNVVPGFDMPVKIIMGGKEVWLKPGEKWAELKSIPPGVNSLETDPDFYVGELDVTVR